MIVKELVSLVREGKNPIVKFKKEVNEYVEDSLDPQMMAKIIGAKEEEDSIALVLDFNGFEQYNRSVASHDWFDENHNPTLTWFDTNFYPKDGIEKIYLPEDIEIPFEFAEQNSLLNEYVQSNLNMSYVEWLEEQVLNLKVR